MYNSAQATYLFMKKSAGELRNEVKALNDADDAKMKQHFQNTLEECEKVLLVHEEKIEEYKKVIESFGESSSNDIAGFFINWNQFANSLRAAVKFNSAMKKKEEAKKKELEKLESRKKKLKQKALELKKAKQEDAAKKEKAGASASSPKYRTKNSLSDSQFDSVMDDLLGEGGDVLGVGALSAGLKSGDAFSVLRGKRKDVKTVLKSEENKSSPVGKSPSNNNNVPDDKKLDTPKTENTASDSPGALKRDISKLSQIQRKRKQRKSKGRAAIDVTW